MRGIKKQASLILALALAVAALVPSVGSAYTRAESGAGVQDNGQPSGITERTPTELAQRQSDPVSGITQRTRTELAQRQSDPVSGITQRTPTELAQRQSDPASAISTPASSRATDNGGFDWGDAAIGAGAMLALGLSAVGIVRVARQRRSTPSLGAVRS
jgi:hypothetical protein